MNSWENAYAQIEMLAMNGYFDPAILWTSLLGNVNLRHNLDTRSDRSQKPARRTVAFHQYTINPIANPYTIRKWLNVYVGSPRIHGLLHHEVDQFDDGGIAVFGRLHGLSRSFRLGEIDGRVGEFGNHGVDRFRFGLSVMTINGADDLLA